MAHYHIGDNDIREINRLRQAQDQNAKALGMLLWEYEEKKAAFYGPKGGIIDLTALGALQHEFEQRKVAFMETIHMTQTKQRLTGERALRDAGLDPEKADYIIDRGHALKLVDGQYVEDF